MKDKKFLIIDSRPYGLFSIFLHTIDNIKWAEDNEYIPVVRWGPGRRDPNAGRDGAAEASIKAHPSFVKDKNNFLTDNSPPSFNPTPGMKHCQCLYYSPEGYNDKTNVWEYYFEPLNKFSLEDALNSEHSVSDIFMVGELDFEKENKFLIANIHSYEPLLLWSYLGIDILDKEVHKKSDEYYHRKVVNQIIEKNVKVRKEIHKKENTFRSKHFANVPTLGVHGRGTDKKLEYPGRALPLNAYIEAIAIYIEKFPNAQIYVASDNNESISVIHKSFKNNKIIVYPAVRMKSYQGGVPICLSSATSPTHGEECLIETLLLSQCDNFICTDSNVAAFAMYLNPEMTVQYLNRKFGV